MDDRDRPNKNHFKALKALIQGRHGDGIFYFLERLAYEIQSALSKSIDELIAPADDCTWREGAVFDGYTLLRRIGRGSNGDVWQADEHGKRDVAIKVLRADLSENPVWVKHFRREIRSVARLKHPHIVDVYHWSQRCGQWYLVMPLLTCGTLRQRIAGRTFPQNQALEWLEQIGKALDHAHQAGLIHGNVKPENMLFDGETLCLADFGLVFSESDVRMSGERRTVESAGRYMARERWRNKPVSQQTDLYALGILAYELLTGHLPFQFDNDRDLRNAHCTLDLPADPRLTPEVLACLNRAAAKSPQERYPSAGAFLSELRIRDAPREGLETLVDDYLDWLTGDIYGRMLEGFVDLEGDVAAREPSLPPMRRHYLDKDLVEEKMMEILADFEREHGFRWMFVEGVREKLITRERVALIGVPGSGRTCMLQRLTVDYARRWADDPARSIPVLIYLNEYAGGSFADLVRESLNMLAPFHDRLLRDGRLVLLCDGFDEMPRDAGQLEELTTYLSAPWLQFVVSCQLRDYPDDLKALYPLEQVELRELELPAIRNLIASRLPSGLSESLWTGLGGSEELMSAWHFLLAKGQWGRLWDAKPLADEHECQNPEQTEAHRVMHSTSARLILLCRNPYMADLLCRMYRRNPGLPESRAMLFEAFINDRLLRETNAAVQSSEQFPDHETLWTGLEALANAMHEAKRTVLSEDSALVAVNAALSTDAATDAEAVLRSALDTRILVHKGGRLKFAHQLLQAHFAARSLRKSLEAGEDPAHLFGPKWWDGGVWRDTTVVLGEFLGEGAKGANRVARWIARASPELALEVITLSSLGLTLADVEIATREALIAGAKDKITESDRRGRTAAYRILGLFDADERPGISLRPDGLPDIDWVAIPDDGEWIFGSEKHSPLPTFHISRYPITYAQFRAFVEAPDRDDERWWEGIPREQKVYGQDHKIREFSEQVFKFANHPRGSVSWYQAVAFCRWLSDKLKLTVTLPTEQQWEKAARGTDGRMYPYGNELDSAREQTWQTRLHRTRAVGIFPEDASPYGVLDMCGNVQEWCSNMVEGPNAFVVDAGGALRRVRGVSWQHDAFDASTVDSAGTYPGSRGYDLGFRVVLSSTIRTARMPPLQRDKAGLHAENGFPGVLCAGSGLVSR